MNRAGPAGRLREVGADFRLRRLPTTVTAGGLISLSLIIAAMSLSVPVIVT